MLRPPIRIQKRDEYNVKMPWLMGPFRTLKEIWEMPKRIPAFVFNRFGEGEYLVTVDWNTGRGRELVWHGVVTNERWRRFKPLPAKEVAGW